MPEVSSVTQPGVESPQPVQGWPALAEIPIVTGTSLPYRSALCGLERSSPDPTCAAAALACLPAGPEPADSGPTGRTLTSTPCASPVLLPAGQSPGDHLCLLCCPASPVATQTSPGCHLHRPGSGPSSEPGVHLPTVTPRAWVLGHFSAARGLAQGHTWRAGRTGLVPRASFTGSTQNGSHLVYTSLCHRFEIC